MRLLFLLTIVVSSCAPPRVSAQKKLPPPEQTLDAMTLTNQYFMSKWPDVGRRIVHEISRASNIWTRAVYYEGLVELYRIDPRPEYLEYMTSWAEFHKWDLRDGQTYTRNADNQCAGQIYIDLYKIDPKPFKLQKIRESIDSMMRTDKIDDWDWIDAIQMAMPIFAEFGSMDNDRRYWERMYEMYMFTRDKHGDNGLFNHEDNLWWRDKDFDPPYREPNGEDCYWSRGNGWVFVALARVLNVIPEDAPHRDQYVNDFGKMASALAKVQRSDGFWNVSLHDPGNYGGKETTGTAMFVYGMAWGIRNGHLRSTEYMPVITRAWNGLLKHAVHKNGFLGYVQGTGKEPKDGQPVTKTSVPNFEDFGLGAFLLAGSEVYRLTSDDVK